VLENMLNLAVRDARARHRVGLSLTARRGRRLEAEAAEVAEIDRWLAQMRSFPEMVLYSANPGPTTQLDPAATRPARRAKKRRR
jgi:hypothetical protein